MVRKFGFKKLPPKWHGVRPRGEPLDIKRKFIILGGVLVCLSIFIGSGLFHFYKQLGRSDFFQITSTEINGCRRTTKEIILQLSDIDIHSNLLLLRSEEIEQRLEAYEWIKNATIIKDWPSRLIIMIEERVPVAMVILDEILYYLDRDAQVFARVSPPEDLDYPVVTGLFALAHEEATAKLALSNIILFLRNAGRGDSILPKQNISEIHITGSGGYILYLVNRPFPIYVDAENMRKSYRRLVRVLHRLYKSKEFSKTEYIRLDYFDDKILVGFDTPLEH